MYARLVNAYVNLYRSKMKIGAGLASRCMIELPVKHLFEGENL